MVSLLCPSSRNFRALNTRWWNSLVLGKYYHHVSVINSSPPQLSPFLLFFTFHRKSKSKMLFSVFCLTFIELLINTCHSFSFFCWIKVCKFIIKLNFITHSHFLKSCVSSKQFFTISSLSLLGVLTWSVKIPHPPFSMSIWSQGKFAHFIKYSLNY